MGAAEKSPVRLVDMTDVELAALVREMVRVELEAHGSRDIMHDHKEAARQLGITPNALHKRIALGHIVPDHRGGRDGIKGNRFAQSTIDAYKRKHSR